MNLYPSTGNHPRPFILHETNLKQLRDHAPRVAVLPWGATEAHGYHLPYGTDVIEATAFAHQAADMATQGGAKVVVLPTVPFGNDEQQLDQVATVSITTATALAILRDVARSMKRQGIDRLVILNGHGGNEFKPMVRDIQAELELLIVVVNFWQLRPDAQKQIIELPGDHADEMETSLLMHLCPNWVVMDQASDGSRNPFTVGGINQPGVWTPRPWSASHPDTGSGDPSRATAEKGKRYMDALTPALAELLVGLSKARKGDLPYL